MFPWCTKNHLISSPTLPTIPTTMATAADLHNQIAAAKKLLEEKKTHTQFLREESTRAEERQRLRRQLEDVQKHISHQERTCLRKNGQKQVENWRLSCAVYLSH